MQLDQESNVVLMMGPPGCGKTTALVESARKAVRRYQRNDALVIVSMTNAAANELASRGLPVVRDHVGTLHAICYREMGRPELVNGHIAEWNADNPGWEMAVSTRIRSPEDDEEVSIERSSGGKGDDLLDQYDLNRHQMIPRGAWTESVLAFAHLWEEWKRENGLIDFTDMIERWYLDYEGMPFGASLLMVDEAQDFSKLEFSVVSKMGQYADFVLICGDEDQCLYQWRGADPESLINQTPRECRILDQSYRLPPQIHTHCQAWVHLISDRIEKPYAPYKGRGEGEVSQQSCNWHAPHELLSLHEQAEKQRKSLMILAACGYQLDPLIKRFREEGIAFANAYRPTKARWNPLSRPSRGIATVDRLVSFRAPHEDETGRLTWTWDELRRWASLVQVKGVFQRNTKARLKTDTPPTTTEDLPLDYIASLCDPAALEPLLNGDLVWLLDHALDSHQARIDYFARVHQKSGIHGWKVPENRPAPGVPTIGTIHSVKGGEADWVYVFPDLSYSGWESWTGSIKSHDTVLRQFYVAVSRAKEHLFLGGGGSHQAVAW